MNEVSMYLRQLYKSITLSNLSIYNSGHPEKATLNVRIRSILQGAVAVDVAGSLVGAQNVFHAGDVAEGLDGVKLQLIQLFYHAQDVLQVML